MPSNKDVETFLKNKAIEFSKRGFSQTHLVFWCTLSSILIGQLGKNYANGNDTLISGDELLAMALNKVKSIQFEMGGRYTYLECEDKKNLIDFYTSNGFVEFGKRNLDHDETDLSGKYLLQFLKKI